jgi:hypothetical protein
MTLIETKTVGSGGSANIEFTGLGSYASLYTDLKIVLSGRTNRSANGDDINISFNGLTTSFTSRFLYGNGASAISSTGTRFAGIVNAASDTASTFGNQEIYIPNYASSNNKSYSIDSVNENNGTTAFAVLTAGLWSNTAAITSISLTSNNAANWVEGTTASLYGISKVTSTPKATGGIVSQDATYWYHTFPFTSTFAPTATITCDYLLIGGGAGGGGGTNAGGGGAGAYRTTIGGSPISLTSGSYAVVVGGGGAGSATNASGSNGGASTFNAISADGGGGGGGLSGSGGIANGNASGGGGAGASGSAANGASGGTYGNAGGNGFNGSTSFGGGGGGGAGSAGGNASSSSAGTAGAGSNSASSWANATFTGVNGYYAGGGGAGGNGITATAGGSGGGGGSLGAFPIQNATTNTGSGGGGSSNGLTGSSVGGNGGSGLLIIRYAK